MKKTLLYTLLSLFTFCSTTNFQIKNDFTAVSKTEENDFLKQENATATNKSVIILTQGFKGEKIVAKQNNKTVYSQYPISNLKTKYADSFSFNNSEILTIHDNFSKKDIVIEPKHATQHKYIYIMKYNDKEVTKYKITLSSTLRPLE